MTCPAIITKPYNVRNDIRNRVFALSLGKRIFLGFLVFGLCVICEGITFIVIQSYPKSFFQILIAPLIVMVYVHILFYLAHFRIGKMKQFNLTLNESRQSEFNEVGVRTFTDTGIESFFPWSRVTSLKSSKDLIIISLGSVENIFYVPETAISREELSELQNFFSSQFPRFKPRKHL